MTPRRERSGGVTGAADAPAAPASAARTVPRRLTGADVMLLGCVLLWSLNITVTKYALGHGFSPLSYAGPRFAIATAAFTGVAVARLGALSLPRPDLLRIAAWGALAISTNQIGFAWSFHFASATVISLLFGTMPIFAGIFTQLFGIERLSPLRWLAAGVSFGGVALVALGASGSVHTSAGGILLALWAPGSFALYSIMLTPLVRLHGTFRVNALASLACLPVMLAAATPELIRTDWGDVTPLAWACLAYSAVIAYAFTNLIWFVAVERIGTARGGMWANLQPFFGAIFALAILSEPMGALQWAGGVAIGAGIVLSRLRLWARRAGAPT